MKYMLNPLIGFYKALSRALEISGMIRAANELERLGYHKEARRIYEEYRER